MLTDFKPKILDIQTVVKEVEANQRNPDGSQEQDDEDDSQAQDSIASQNV